MGSSTFKIIADILSAGLVGGEPGLVGQQLAGIADWPAIVRVADRHHVLSALAPALVELGLLNRLPLEVADLLVFVHQANTARNDKLRTSMLEALQALDEVGIEPVLLKGAVRLMDGLYRDPGVRLMADLDLLAPEGRAEEAQRRLVGLGYTEQLNGPPHHHHLPSLIHVSTGVQIEIHHRVLLEPVGALLGMKEIYDSARLLDVAGRRVLVPDPINQLLHMILHDQVANRGLRHGRISLRVLLEARLLLCQMDDGEVRQVLDRLNVKNLRRAGSVFLTAVDALFGGVPKSLSGDGIDRLMVRRAVWQQRIPRLLAAQRHLIYLSALLLRLRHSWARQRLRNGIADPAYLKRRKRDFRKVVSILDPTARF